jgi:hypothetical protein
MAKSITQEKHKKLWAKFKCGGFITWRNSRVGVVDTGKFMQTS